MKEIDIFNDWDEEEDVPLSIFNEILIRKYQNLLNELHDIKDVTGDQFKI